jgi:hypothetical protein
VKLAGRTVYDDLADRIRQLARHEARSSSPPVDRGTVVSATPLVVDLGGGLVLEEGDPDVEFDRGVLSDRPAKGDAVRVHSDGQDYIVTGVIEAGADG